MHVSVLNGPNLNLLGHREPEIYGRQTLDEVERLVRAEANRLSIELDWMQTNHEGELVEAVHRLRGRSQGAILNPAAYTHTSLALRDAVLAVGVPFVEVHVSNPLGREALRRRSLLSDLAVGVVMGFGGRGYVLALQGLVGRLRDE